MAHFVTLVRYTHQGMSKIKESPSRLDAAKKAAEATGGKILTWYLTMGQYDAVLVTEFPNDEACAKFTLSAGALGNISLRLVIPSLAGNQPMPEQVSLPAYSHPRQLPSELSCVRQSPRPSSLPPSVEAAERTRKRLHTVTCYQPCFWQEWRDTDWFTTRVPDQIQKRPHLIQSVNRPSPYTLQ
jgi:uncharacterized protein with GYD domain